MATYTELADLIRDQPLRDKITASCLVAADTIRQEDGATTNHANRVIWAKKVLADPRAETAMIIPLVIAANRAATAEAISGASDAAIQSAVDAVIDFVADGS